MHGAARRARSSASCTKPQHVAASPRCVTAGVPRAGRLHPARQRVSCGAAGHAAEGACLTGARNGAGGAARCPPGSSDRHACGPYSGPTAQAVTPHPRACTSRHHGHGGHGEKLQPCGRTAVRASCVASAFSVARARAVSKRRSVQRAKAGLQAGVCQTGRAATHTRTSSAPSQWGATVGALQQRQQPPAAHARRRRAPRTASALRGATLLRQHDPRAASRRLAAAAQTWPRTRRPRPPRARCVAAALLGVRHALRRGVSHWCNRVKCVC